ncbi:CobW family GTP-binding protein [Marinobacter sp. F4206]|uniref:CobW family GTP-binding protein n=1 Tax=Marinobacter sp. F4206 TaxID=2861777 RepID=UPI001C5F0F8F|nr:GTP-binding protein [Marinobacter sp. F4206]MBW4936031.1 GTP-binding protein [Marinobacter sp. F4206]
MDATAPPQLEPVPVTIITGFLGAGKTSLLNHILSGKHGRRIAVLVNDFGAVNIDEALIENREGEVISLANGCICCSLSAGLQVSAARLVRRRPQPDHIIIETSGVSDPFEVANAFNDPDLKPFAPLEGVVTVVDAELAPTLEGDMLNLARCQVYAADVIILNKTDLVDEGGRRRAMEWLQTLAPHARVIESVHGRVPLELLFDIGGAAELERGAVLRNNDGARRHDEPPFDTYTFESDIPLPVQRLHTLLRRLPKTVFRVKGIINLAEKPEHPCVLQATGKRAALTIGQPWGERRPATQIVFIGARGGVDAVWLKEQLAGASIRESV